MAGWLISVALGSFSQLFELLFYFSQLFVGKIFQIDQLISRLLQRANDLIEFQVHRFGVAVLGVLDQEHHQERNDGRSRIDDQLPGIGKMKCWTGEKPDQDHEHGSSKGPGASEHDGGTAGENTKNGAHSPKQRT